MKQKTPELTTQEMAAARLLSEGKSQAAIAAECGMSTRTLARKLSNPQFIAYQNLVRAEKDKDLKKQTDAAAKKIDFSKPEGVEFLVKILKVDVDRTGVRCSDQLKALEMLGKMLGWVPGDPNPESKPDEVPAAPNVYRSAWRQ